ncbi:MAG: hypothetical protein LC713_07710, partial [Actinobacteria bacterium]|nr:hypothetical protein [Actinomycetota bacterium]
LGLVCVLGLAFGAHGYVGRYLAADNPPDRALYAVAAVRRATGPIASSPGVFVLLRGDRLEHSLALVGSAETCALVRSRLRRGPLVLAAHGSGGAAACVRGLRLAAADRYEAVYAVAYRAGAG